MRRFVPPALFVLALVGAPIYGALSAIETRGYTGKVSALRVVAGSLGNDWTGPTGLVVDDFQDVAAIPPEDRQIVEELKKQVSPLGVVAVADYTYRKRSDPLHQITLRIFVFDSEKSCRDWWQKKHRFDGWEKLYSVVGGVPYDGLDSKEMTKRIVSMGNVWMTCGSLKKSDDHLKVLDLYVEKVKAATESK